MTNVNANANASALANYDPNSKEMAMILANVDTTGLTVEQKQEVALVLYEDYMSSKQGFNFKPQRYKINKDTQTFTDPLGKTYDEIRGVAVFKQKIRGWWKKGEKVPLCSSFDCVTGIDRDGKQRPCVGCPQNEWGSAPTEDGEARKGKACKEMRRAFFIPSEQIVPIVVSFPPTSIGPWDDFFSARITQGISDLAAEVAITLVPATANGFDYSVVKLKSGAKVAPKDLLEFNKVRKQFSTVWEREEITADDYVEQPVAGDANGAGTGQQTFAGNNAAAAGAGDEPY
jgi:hypothetical protein